jgi:hypothetical protein
MTRGMMADQGNEHIDGNEMGSGSGHVMSGIGRAPSDGRTKQGAKLNGHMTH